MEMEILLWRWKWVSEMKMYISDPDEQCAQNTSAIIFSFNLAVRNWSVSFLRWQ